VDDETQPDENPTSREALVSRLRRVAGPQLIALLVLFVLALLQLGRSTPDADTPEGVVPAGARLIAQQTFGEAYALLIRRRGSFQLLMAYKARDRWIGVPARQPERPGDYAVARSTGHPPIPAFTAVYGQLRDPADTRSVVRVAWENGPQDVPLVDGAFLVLREGRFSVTRVSLVEPGGAERPLLRSQ
jgi:hypothetical protein